MKRLLTLLCCLAMAAVSFAQDAQTLLVNEIQVANVDMYLDPSMNYGGWIELYNAGTESVDLKRCYFSDDPTDLRKFRTHNLAGTYVVKPGEFLVVYFEHYSVKQSQINFKLKYEGGSIYISDLRGNILAQQDYPAAICRTSWARTTDGGNEWGYTAYPTPGATNATSTFAEKRLAAPEIDTPSGLFKTKQTFKVTIPDGATLRYTTNGSTPTETSGQTSRTGSFTTTATRVYRFRLFKEGMLPSAVVTRTFILNDKNYSLPIVSVVGADADIWGEDHGGLADGNGNGVRGNGQADPKNYNGDWDRPVNFEYILPTGESVINQEVDLESCGGWSRAFVPHSFKIKATKLAEGVNHLDYPFFNQKPYNKNKVLQIRNGGNDTSCRIKDAAICTMANLAGINIDAQAYQPACIFVNGVYKYILNIREPNNRYYAYANYGWDDDEIDCFETRSDSGHFQMQGTRKALDDIVNYSKNASKPSVYEKIKELLDIDNFINYTAAQLYVAGDDWAHNNVKGIRYKDGGKYRFVMYDTDNAFMANPNSFDLLASKTQWTWAELYNANGLTGVSRTQSIPMVNAWLGLLKNAEFRRQLINTLCLMGGSVYQSDRVSNILDSLGKQVTKMQAIEGGSPTATINSMKDAFSTRAEKAATEMKNFSNFQLTKTDPVQCQINSNTPGARLFVDDSHIPYDSFNGYLFPPVTISAQAPAGYKFVGWKYVEGQELMAKGHRWKYFDQGPLTGKKWYAVDFDDSDWKSGLAPLGYAMDGIKTTISYGDDPEKKHTTTFLRTTFNLSSTLTSSQKLVMSFKADDGFRVYINGRDVGRHNLPTGVLSYSTFASTNSLNPNIGTLVLTKSSLKEGENVIAVEVHQYSADSGDLMFDCSLSIIDNTTEMDLFTTDSSFKLPTRSGSRYQACFEPLSKEELEQEGIVPVRINEISGANNSYSNDYLKHGDWVELFNTTSQPIDIAGMYLSNNPDLPLLYQVPTNLENVNTIIPANGTLVIWCDKLETKQMIHAPFNISKAGGTIVLTSADQSWKDELEYPAHGEFVTIGRYPDGANPVYVMDRPSIDKPNIFTISTVMTPQWEALSIKNVTIHPQSNPIEIQYHEGEVQVTTHAPTVNITIYQISGQKLQTATVSTSSDIAIYAVPTSSLDKGCYVAKAVDSNGNSKSVKFIIQ